MKRKRELNIEPNHDNVSYEDALVTQTGNGGMAGISNSDPPTSNENKEEKDMVLVPQMFSFPQQSENTRAKMVTLSRSASLSTASILSKTASQECADPLLNKIFGVFDDLQNNIGYFSTREFVVDLKEICQRAIRIFNDEKRLLRISSPVYCFGDIHGNLKDLLYFKRRVWPLSMNLTAGKFLFLGDYVDRGKYGVEVVAYLLASKVAYPEKVFLLRGNHEVADVNAWQAHYGDGSFIRQCTVKYGEELGKYVWKICNKVFDFMPLAAVIDDKVFAAHGGIPRVNPKPIIEGEDPDYEDDFADSDDNRLEAINAIPCPAGIIPPLAGETPESITRAIDLLWADPADAIQESRLSNAGYGESVRGKTAICYGNSAIDRFLKNQNLSHIIRAHESINAGIKVSKSAKVITVFSTSENHGQRGRGSCGCLLIENGRIMAINRINALAEEDWERYNNMMMSAEVLKTIQEENTTSNKSSTNTINNDGDNNNNNNNNNNSYGPEFIAPRPQPTSLVARLDDLDGTIIKKKRYSNNDINIDSTSNDSVTGLTDPGSPLPHMVPKSNISLGKFDLNATV